MEIPKQYTDMVGTKQELSGGLFSRNRNEPVTEFDVLDIKFGEGTIVNLTEIRKTGKSSYEHPTFKLLVKNEKMKKARWTRGFAIREINLIELKNLKEA